MTRKLLRILIPFLLAIAAVAVQVATADPPPDKYDISLYGVSIELQPDGKYTIAFRQGNFISQDQIEVWRKILIDGQPIWTDTKELTRDLSYNGCQDTPNCDSVSCVMSSCGYRDSSGFYHFTHCTIYPGPCNCTTPPIECRGLGGYCGCPVNFGPVIVPDINIPKGATLTIEVGPVLGDTNLDNNIHTVQF